MKTSVSWSMVAMVAMVAFLAAGCNTSGPRSEGSSSARAAYPLGDKPLTPRTPTGPGVPCPAGGGDACAIKVKVNSSDCDPAGIELDEYVLLPDVTAKKRIVWELPVGYNFCSRAGDGVFLKDPNVPDNFFEPMPEAGCSRTYEWKRKRADGNNFEYYLRFRSANNICVKDPWMRN